MAPEKVVPYFNFAKAEIPCSLLIITTMATPFLVTAKMYPAHELAGYSGISSKRYISSIELSAFTTMIIMADWIMISLKISIIDEFL